MKKMIFIFFLLVLPFAAGATGQSAERIFIDGEEWELLGCPIELDSLLSEKVQEHVPKDIIFSTGCYRGYIGTWELKDNRLYLRSLSFDVFDGANPLDNAILESIFEPYCTDEGILASWVTATLRVGRGECITHIDEGFYRNYEQESLLTIHTGTLANKKEYRNYVKKGVSWDDIEKSLQIAFPAKLLRKDEIFTLVAIEDVIIDDNANLVDCNLQIKVGDNEMLTDQNNPDIINLKSVLKQQSPWTYSYINGEIIAYGYWLYMYNRPLFWHRMETLVNDIYDEVERMAGEGNVNSGELVDKYCSNRFRQIYRKAYEWAAENNETVFDFCHWIRMQDYENPEFKFLWVDDRNIRDCDYKMTVKMLKTDTIGGCGVAQEFFLYMQKIGGRWWINDFGTPGEKTDAAILKSNMDRPMRNAM